MSKDSEQPNLSRVTSSSSNELKVIATKREALEQVVKISLSISHLQKGLDAMLSMEKKTSEIPKAAFKIYSKLSEDVKNYPTTKITESYDAIEEEVKRDLDAVLRFTQTEEEISDDQLDEIFSSDMDPDTIFEKIKEFKRRAQTFLALSILLRKRGVTPRKIVLPVKKDALRKKISRLEEKEQQCRKKIQKEFYSMDSYISNVISGGNCPDALREELEGIRDSIKTNMEHLNAGRPIEDLPIAMEIVEMGTEDDHAVPFQPTSLPEEAPVAPTEEEISSEKKKVKLGFFQRLKLWSTAPFGTKWRDIPRYREK